MFNDPPEEVGRKWCQLREAEVYLPLFTIHPILPSLHPSSFLLPLLPCCPALSSQNPSPINPSFSSLALLLRLLKTGISGIAKTLIFDHPYHHHPPSPQYLCHGSGASCMLPLSWLLEISHAWSPPRSMDMPLYSKYSLLSLLSVC